MDLFVFLEQLDDEDLQAKVGRNVVTIQKIEAILKFLIATRGFSVYIHKVKACLARQAAAVGNQTLGAMVTQLRQEVLTESDRILPTDSCPAEALFPTDFKAGSDNEGGDEARLQAALDDLVDERNDLIHGLARKLSTCGGRDELLTYLDAQHERTQHLYATLTTIAMHLRHQRMALLEELQHMVLLEPDALFNPPLPSRYVMDKIAPNIPTANPIPIPSVNTTAQTAKKVPNAPLEKHCITILQTLAKSGDSNGWVNIADAGTALKRDAPGELDTLKKQHGCKTLRDLICYFGLFEVKEEKTAKGSRVQFRLKPTK